MSIETCTWRLSDLFIKASEIDPKKASDYEDLYYFSDMSLYEYVQRL